MSRSDALLFSIVVGMSLFTIYLFASEYPGDAAPPRPSRPIQTIILHGLTGAHDVDDLPFHVYARPDGPLHTGFWESGEATGHTGSEEVNRASIAVAIEPGATYGDVIDLRATMCRDFGLDADSIYAHDEIDRGEQCPGPGLDLDYVRAQVNEQIR